MADQFEKADFKKTEWIPVKNISVVWVQAQRPLNEKHAQSIADNFDPDKFGILAVTKPNGHGVFHVIDGHHRKVAVEKLWGKDEKVPCQVFDAEDPARAAELFDSINTKRRAPQPIEIFRVRVTAGEEIQVAVDKIVKSCDLTVGFRAERSISCVGALESVYQSYGPNTLRDTLHLILAIWGPEPVAREASMVRGIGSFLSEYRDIDFKRLREVVSKRYTPSRLLGAAKTAKEINGGNTPNAIKELLATTYNKGLHASKRLTMKTKGK